MKLGKLFVSAVVAASALAFTATSASAYVACNRSGECWHVKSKYRYHPSYGVVVHPNSWRWGAHDNYKWREHTGRGYWRNGIWIRF